MNPTRVAATLVRPGHTVFLEYGRDLLIDVTEVHVEPEWVRLCGNLKHPQDGTILRFTDDSRHRLTGRLKVVGDRNEPHRSARPAWHDLTRVCRHWDGAITLVWSLDDAYEPFGHGARLRGWITMTRGGWVWRAAFGGASGTTAGDYLGAEAVLLDATAGMDKES